MSGTKLVCLLPVRNGEEDLPGYFESVARFADVIVALDDGSTDGTREMLERHPLVARVLESPRRDTYAGWDDAENRNRLLEAAAELEPEWIISLDADERIPADDAAALREFIEHDALPGCAYLFEIFRMWQDLDHYETAGFWVCRLFAFEPGQRFPDQRLHFVPVPTDIPRSRWLYTTVRIQHLGAVTGEHRRARFEKYRQADPNDDYHQSYKDLLEDPVEVRPWEAREPGLGVLNPSADDTAAAIDDARQRRLADIGDGPALTAVVISRNDEARIARTVRSIVTQECPWPFEVIVVTSGTDRTAQIVREQFPEVTVIALDHPALPGEARNAGLRIARGEYITFPGSHVELTPGSFAARLRAHDLGYAMVTGSTRNGTKTWAGWASYFIDHSAMLPGRPSDEFNGPPPHCSYRRSALLDVGGFPEDMRAGEDTVANHAMARRGYTAYWDRDVQFIHHSPCRTPWRLVAHHFVRGRGFGRILHDQGLSGRKAFTGRRGYQLVRKQTLGRAAQKHRDVQRWGTDPDLRRHYRRSWPVMMAGIVASCAGTCFELFHPSDAGLPIQPGGMAIPPDVHPSPSGDKADIGLLPHHRIVAYYGHATSAGMGILGEHEMPALLARLREQAEEYAVADTGRPVLPAFELIAVMAQREPGTDGLHRTRIRAEVLDAYARFTEANDIPLILDVQPGLACLSEEVAALVPWLRRSHIHLGLDPEWALKPGQLPGIDVGAMDVAEITGIQQALSRLVAEEGLPPKMLIVHQFRAEMIRGKVLLRPQPGVQLVIDCDGFGSPASKRNVYRALIRQERVGYAGVKLFYRQDSPLMPAEDVLALGPAPDVVIYQ
jgi:glycosyltransferase involved in cell wall biosynthesis